jgi:hypothetical protein
MERKLISRIRGLCWKPLTIKEIYIYIGILIYMSSNRKPKIIDYWNVSRGSLDSPSGVIRYIFLRRFQLIFKLFTVSPNSASNDNEISRAPLISYHKFRARRMAANEDFSKIIHPNHWWKVESLATHIWLTCMRVYISGTHIIIDEVILAFRGRFKDTTKFKGKLIKEGYKNWILAEYGYVWLWLWHSIKIGTKNFKASFNSRILKVLSDI